MGPSAQSETRTDLRDYAKSIPCRFARRRTTGEMFPPILANAS
jgi:hypothetical protein